MEGTNLSNDAFITGVDAGGPTANLDQVRQDNEKMKQIVSAFSNKVETLIDKQRNEYILAYEVHMQEVQKELHSLREKVADIANDDTKNEKTETLKLNQKKYKEEALKLENDSDEILKKIKKLVRKVYTVEKSRDWMLKRLRQAKQEYNTLLKERNRLYENWDNGTMTQSLASMSNASSYTLDLKQSLKHAAIGGLKLNNETPTTQALSRVQAEFGVKRQASVGTLPALSTKLSTTQQSQGSGSRVIKPWDFLPARNPGSTVTSVMLPSVKVSPEVAKSQSLPALHPSGKVMSKSKSGPELLLETFANTVNGGGGRKSRGTASATNLATGGTAGDQDSVNGSVGSSAVPVAERTAEDVDEKLALTRLIALRARRKEVREFLQSCSKSLHRGPWCRVKPRPLPELLLACQDKIADSGSKFRSEELLQLVCELAVYPETYEALTEIFDSYAPLPANYMSDEEIEASAVVRSPHRLGIDPVADELIMRFGDFDLLRNGEGEGEIDSRTDASSANYGVDLEPSDAAVDFRDRMNKILRGNTDAVNENAGATAGEGAGEGSVEPSTKKAGGSGIPGEVNVKTTKAGLPRKVLGGTLDKDLRAYFMQEDHTRRLSNMGFFERDDFMDFD